MSIYTKHRSDLEKNGFASWSQFGEDLRIEEILRILCGEPPRNKVFLELGAVNGVTHSNTLHFEEKFGWSGVLIEPSPLAYAQLCTNRPNSKCFNYAISVNATELSFYGHNSLGVVAEKATDEYLDRWHKGTESYKVPAIPIRNLVSSKDYPVIHFFSLDVEGSEYEVLSSFDWTIDVCIICIELFGDFNNSWREECRMVLRSNGFNLLETFHINEIWINRTNILNHLPSTPERVDAITR